MCSIGEDDFGDEGGAHAMPEDDALQDSNGSNKLGEEICQKCDSGEIVAVKLMFREAECKNCFLAHVRHKFRATLGSSKILPKNSDVLLIIDGSPESLVLLDMLDFAQSQTSFKRLHCNVKILHIDESCLTSTNSSSNKICQYLRKFNFHSILVSIIKGCDELFDIKDLLQYQNYLNENHEKVKIFVKDFENIKTLTARQDFIEKWKKNLIYSIANKLNLKFVFLPNISFDLAINLLTNVSLGRGGSTALDVALCDDRFANIIFIRPIKDLTKQEIEEYVKVMGLHDFNQLHYGQHFGSSASIQNLTKNFVENLQKGFSSTVSTVFRTGDKISSSSSTTVQKLEELSFQETKCNLCNAKLDCLDSQTLLAIEFSSLVSENKCGTVNLENIDTLCKNKLINGNNDEVLKKLCHSCRNIYNECLNPDLFC